MFLDQSDEPIALYDDNMPATNICFSLLHELVHFITGNYNTDGYNVHNREEEVTTTVEKATDYVAYEIFTKTLLRPLSQISGYLRRKWEVSNIEHLANKDNS